MKEFSLFFPKGKTCFSAIFFVPKCIHIFFSIPVFPAVSFPVCDNLAPLKIYSTVDGTPATNNYIFYRPAPNLFPSTPPHNFNPQKENIVLLHVLFFPPVTIQYGPSKFARYLVSPPTNSDFSTPLLISFGIRNPPVIFLIFSDSFLRRILFLFFLFCFFFFSWNFFCFPRLLYSPSPL